MHCDRTYLAPDTALVCLDAATVLTGSISDGDPIVSPTGVFDDYVESYE